MHQGSGSSTFEMILLSELQMHSHTYHKRIVVDQGFKVKVSCFYKFLL